jgi:hypothetical protein
MMTRVLESLDPEAVHAGCMFPPVSERGNRCGPVVLRLSGQGTDPELALSWTERNGGE